MIIVGCDGSCRYIDKRRCFILYKIIKVWMGNTYMSNIEIYFKSTELILSAIGLVFVIFGWIIPYNQTKKEENKRGEFELDITRRQWKKDLIDKQISNLYGPISSLLNSQNIRFAFIKYQLGRNYIFGKDQTKLKDLTEEEQKIWVHFVNTYVLPTNGHVIKILEENQHLIFNSEIPICLNEFKKYALGWELLDNQKKQSVPNYYEYYFLSNYPVDFQNYINLTLKELYKEQAKLLQLSNDSSTIY